MALCDQPKTVTAFPVVASSTMIASCKMVKPSSTDVLRTKLLTPVSGYNSSGVKTACSARRTDLQRIGGVNIDGGGSGIPVGPKNKVVKFAGNGGIIAAAAGRVSAVVAAMLGAYARDFQGISAQIAGFHNQFVGALRGGAAAYASAEAANVQQTVVNAVNAPAQALLGHPLIGPETVGSSAAAVSFGFGPLLLAGSDPLLAVPFSYPASLPTPFGPVTMTLNGSFDPLTQQVVFDSGSLTAPAPFVYGLGAVGPALTTMTALQNSGTAFSGAVQSGNLLGAAGALLQAPGNAVTGFLFGQTAISQSIPGPSNLGYESVGISVPVGGLLAPLQPVTVTLTPTSGMPTAIQLSGTQFGGLLPALLNGF